MDPRTEPCGRPIALSAPRLRSERDPRRLEISLAPASNVVAATIGLFGALALVSLGVAGAVPLIVAAVAFVGALAMGFVMASRERTRYRMVVEHAIARLNGQTLALPLPDDLSGGAALTASEQRWVREVVTARIAGDEDARGLTPR